MLQINDCRSPQGLRRTDRLTFAFHPRGFLKAGALQIAVSAFTGRSRTAKTFVSPLRVSGREVGGRRGSTSQHPRALHQGSPGFGAAWQGHTLAEWSFPRHPPAPRGAAGAPQPRWEGPLLGPSWGVSLLERVQVPPRAQEGFADSAACGFIPGLAAPPEAALGLVPAPLSPAQAVSASWQDSPGPSAPAPSVFPRPCPVLGKTPAIYSRQLDWLEKKNMLLFVLKSGFFFCVCASKRGCQ